MNYDDLFPSMSSIEIQNPALSVETESNPDLFSQASLARRSQSQKQWNSLVISAMKVASAIDPFEENLPVGTVVPSVSVLDWQVGRHNCDLRPRLTDKSTGEARMIDTGSMITATRRLPGDQKDQNLKLLAVNGSEIETFGRRNIQFKINRKTYEMQAIVCDIAQDILGMDFMTKYKLGFD